MPLTHHTFWDFVISEVRNKSWKVAQQHQPPAPHLPSTTTTLSKFCHRFAICRPTQVDHNMVALADKSANGNRNEKKFFFFSEKSAVDLHQEVIFTTLVAMPLLLLHITCS